VAPLFKLIKVVIVATHCDSLDWFVALWRWCPGRVYADMAQYMREGG
jgi:hypothetical protein